jgi:hypothetical protein
MEENRYYTPEISEFHVGFEYEWRYAPRLTKIAENPGEYVFTIDLIQYPNGVPKEVTEERQAREKERVTWKKVILTEEILEFDRDGGHIENPFIAGYDIEFRVPYLTKEDIEGEGFKFIDKGEYEVNSYFSKNINYHGNTIEYRVRLWSDYRVDLWSEDTGAAYFDGIIKNKSEFRKILKMIGSKLYK